MLPLRKQTNIETRKAHLYIFGNKPVQNIQNITLKEYNLLNSEFTDKWKRGQLIPLIFTIC